MMWITMGFHSRNLLLLTVFLSSQLSIIQGFRLPATQIPSKYDIHLTFPDSIFDGTSSTFSGVVTVSFEVTEPTKTVFIHAPGYDKSSRLVNKNTPFDPILLDQPFYNSTSEILSLTYYDQLEVNSTYELTLEFDANVDVIDRRGIYRNTYTDEHGLRYLVTTQFQPTYARKAFPCFDEPRFKAVFNLSLTYPSIGFNTISNTAIHTTDEPESGSSKTVQFEITPKMSTYLLGFIISNFTCTWGSSIPNSISHMVCSRPITQYERYLANSNGAKIVQALQSATGINYTEQGIGKLHHVAVPDFYAGAMENWGVPIYRESYLLWNQENSSSYFKQKVLSIISHELAHFWFGNLVTTEWWDTLFLNEGFATYFEYFIPASISLYEIEENWQMSKQFIIEQVQTALASDGHSSSKALSSPVETPEEINEHFSIISYRKGGSILRMIENFVGSTIFSNGIKKYMDQRKFDTALPKDLWNSLESELPTYALPTAFSGVIENWINSPGYPVLTVSADDSNVVITQKRFFYDNSTNDSTQWYVPISYTVASDPSQFSNPVPKTWLIPGDSNATLFNVLKIDDWIVFNNQQSAFYRVNYDNNLWDRIKKQLMTNHQAIDVLNRAQIVDDVFNLARAEELNYNQALSIINYLFHETDYFPWYAAVKGFDYLTKVFGENSETGIKLLEFQNYLLQKVFEVTTFSLLNGSDQIHTLKQRLILNRLCRLGEKNCIANAKTLYQDYVNGKKIDRNFKSVVYCNAMRYSDDVINDWLYLFDQLFKTQTPTEQQEIISGLGCAENQYVLNFYLQQAMDPSSGLRIQDFSTIWSSIYSSSKFGLEIALIFFTENHEAISSYYTEASKIFSNIVSRISTQEQLSHLEGFLSSSSLSEELRTKTLATATANLEWSERRKSEILQYFSENPIPETTYPPVPPTTTSTTTTTTTTSTTTTTTSVPTTTTSQATSTQTPATLPTPATTTTTTTTVTTPSNISTVPPPTSAGTPPTPPVDPDAEKGSTKPTTLDGEGTTTSDEEGSIPDIGERREVSIVMLITMFSVALIYLTLI